MERSNICVGTKNVNLLPNKDFQPTYSLGVTSQFY